MNITLIPRAPVTMPNATPTHTAYTRVVRLKVPLLSFSAVRPSTLSAGSARVARKPSRKTVHSTSATPPLQ